MKIIEKIDDSFGCGQKFIYVIEIASNIFVDTVQVIDDDESYFFYMLDDCAYERDENNEINMLYNYALDENKLYGFLDERIKEEIV